MKVLFFAGTREATDCDTHVLDADRTLTQSEFWELLIQAIPTLAPFQKSARLARRETYLHGDEPIEPGDEVAVIPPVSGG